MDNEKKNNLDKESKKKNNKKGLLEKNKEDIIKHLHEMKDSDIFGSKSKYAERMENDLEEQKYIREMQDMEDKLAKKNNLVIVSVVGVILLVIIVLGVKIMKSPVKDFTITNKTKVEDSGDNNNVTKDNTKKEEEAIEKNKDNAQNKDNKDNLPEQNYKIYTYAIGTENRANAIKEAIKLNENNKSGITAIFIAEILRKAEVKVPMNITNTKSLVENLQSQGWKKLSDPKGLKKGDICFTTDMSDMEGYPSHVYIFMGWVKEGDTREAYVCDSLVEQNKDSIHKRNIDNATEDKQKMNFYMRK